MRITIKRGDREYVLPESLARRCKKVDESEEPTLEFSSELDHQLLEELVKQRDNHQLTKWIQQRAHDLESLVELLLIAERLGMPRAIQCLQLKITQGFIQGTTGDQLRDNLKLPRNLSEAETVEIEKYVTPLSLEH